MESGADLPLSANSPSGPPDAVVFTWATFFAAMFVGWLLAQILSQYAYDFEFHDNNSYPLIVMAIGIGHLVVRRQIRERSAERYAGAIVRQWVPVIVCSCLSCGFLPSKETIGILFPYLPSKWIDLGFLVVGAPLIIFSCLSLFALPWILLALFLDSLRRSSDLGYASLVETSAITFAIASFPILI